MNINDTLSTRVKGLRDYINKVLSENTYYIENLNTNMLFSTLEFKDYAMKNFGIDAMLIVCNVYNSDVAKTKTNFEFLYQLTGEIPITTPVNHELVKSHEEQLVSLFASLDNKENEK